jgi:hypothetical protein
MPRKAGKGNPYPFGTIGEFVAQLMDELSAQLRDQEPIKGPSARKPRPIRYSLAISREELQRELVCRRAQELPNVCVQLGT